MHYKHLFLLQGKAFSINKATLEFGLGWNFAEFLERKTHKAFGKARIQTRYADTTLLMTDNEDKAESILEFLNKQHPNFDFSMETEPFVF